jgi:hypothetical protein
MSDLSAYIAFNAILSKDQVTSSLILSDPDSYPAGVDHTLKGYFQITQPDGITITGNYSSPDIYWTGTQLSLVTKELRLTAVGGFQQGLYTIKYFIEATGYNETTLTKTFTLTYTTPVATVAASFDVFTPDLSVTDNTVYTQSGMNFSSVIRHWQADILTVSGTTQTIFGSLQTFDLNYLGSYYDSRYDVSLTATPTYVLSSPNNWVTVVDQVDFSTTYYAFIPPSLTALLALLTTYKATVDASNCICGSGCVDNCNTLKATYSLAVSIYTHIVERGRLGVITGLDQYVLQLQKLLSNCVTPAYTNTNNPINPYHWGTGSGSSNYTFYKQMIVGSGINNAPPDNGTTYTDTNLINKSVTVFLDGLELGTGLSDRISYTYNTAAGTITWNTPLQNLQMIRLYTY